MNYSSNIKNETDASVNLNVNWKKLSTKLKIKKKKQPNEYQLNKYAVRRIRETGATCVPNNATLNK